MNGSNMTDREAIAELVALKDLKDEFQAIDQARSTDAFREFKAKSAEYDSRKPLAWAAARARLALPAESLAAEQPQALTAEQLQWLRLRGQINELNVTPTGAVVAESSGVAAGETAQINALAPSDDGFRIRRDERGEIVFVPNVEQAISDFARAHNHMGSLLAYELRQIKPTQRTEGIDLTNTDQGKACRAAYIALKAAIADQINAPAGTPALPSDGK